MRSISETADLLNVPKHHIYKAIKLPEIKKEVKKVRNSNNQKQYTITDRALNLIKLELRMSIKKIKEPCVNPKKQIFYLNSQPTEIPKTIEYNTNTTEADDVNLDNQKTQKILNYSLESNSALIELLSN